MVLEKKQERGQLLRPSEDSNLGDYKETISSGIPVDSNHPGVVNLTEHEKDRLKDFENMNPHAMSPQDKDMED